MDLVTILVLGIVAFTLFRLAQSILSCNISHIPGPFWTRSNLLARIYFGRYAVTGKRHLLQHRMLDDAAKEGCKVVRFAPTTVLVADPAIVSVALATADGWRKDPMTYRSDKDGTRSLFSHVDPDQHKILRRKLSPAFSIKSLNDMEPIVRFVVSDFLEKLSDMAKSGESADFLKLYSLFTGDVIGQVAFGESWGLVKQGHSEVLEHSERMIRGAMFRGALGSWAPLVARYVKIVRESIDSARYMEEYAMKVAQDRRSGRTEPRDDLLQRICDTVDPETGEKLTDKEVANNCILVIAAGDETTSHQLSFVTYHLLSNPDKMRKLQAEVDQAAKANSVPRDKLVEHSILKDLPYLNAVLNESLRLLPTTYSITRRVVPEGGFQHPTNKRIFLPAGTSLSIINGYMCRDKEVFGEDADSFVPERWLGEKGLKEADVKFSFTPFSRGPRNCIGSGLALMEMRLLIANVFRNFDLHLVDKSLADKTRQLETRIYLTNAPKKGELDITVSERK